MALDTFLCRPLQNNNVNWPNSALPRERQALVLEIPGLNIKSFLNRRCPWRRRLKLLNREFKITTTATATGTSLNKRFNEQNNSCARALKLIVHFFAVLCKTTT